MDFMVDSFMDGRRFRVLTVVDIYSRHSPIIEADLALNGSKVVTALERATKHVGYPSVIQVDNGSECQSKVLDAWAFAHGVKLDFIRPGKPVDNCYIESFNARLRDECFNANVFTNLPTRGARLKPGELTTTSSARTVRSAIALRAKYCATWRSLNLPLGPPL